jgi:outer membrane protein insertion porin family
MNFSKRFLLIILFLSFPVSILSAQNEPAPAAEDASLPSERRMVKAVDISGNKSISVATILSKIKTRAGQEYLQNVISDDLKRLYNLGYFSDVSVDREEVDGGFRVIFYVVEKPLIEEISFSQLKYFRPKALMKKIKSKEKKFLDSKTLNDDIRTIEELYDKKGLTLVEVDVEKDLDELTNKAKLHFVIKEGYRIKVKNIKFEGNESFPAKRILKVIKTRKNRWYRKSYLKEEILEEDMERIKSFYEKEGFIDAAASFKYDQYDDGNVNLVIHIYQGKQYFVDKVTMVGNAVVSEHDILEKMVEIKPGKVFSREKLSVDIASIRTLYFDQGYIFANVRESTSLNTETGKVEIKLDVQEGNLAYVNRIKIQGNDRTRDIVIRRELRLYPGDKFDGEKLRRSKQRLRNLGYFEDINYDIQDTDKPDQKDLVVQVKETKTGTFSFGGGYSTVDQVVGFIEVEQKNFDFTNWPAFTGGGQNLQIRAETGSTRHNTRLSFTEPWIFDHPISGGFDAYITERDREKDVGFAYDEKRVGGDIRFGKQFTEYVSGNLDYRREDITIGNFEEGVSADLLSEEGKNTVSSVGLSVSRDKRDNVFTPTTGWFITGGTDIAGGVLGGDKDFYRINMRTSYHIPFKFDSVVEFRLRAGIIDSYGDTEKVPIFERFFAGGARSIRGYDERRVGPLDSVTEDPIGGESLLVGNIEYTVPLIDFLKMAVFLDTGSVWSKVKDFGSGEFKSGTGLGLRVKTPIGPVNLDYGYPLNDEPGEEERSGKFYFSVSRGF